MTIHKGNIEAYLLDYLEGNLDALLTAELMAFLSENPEYEKWIPEYDGHVCDEGDPVFDNKLLLKKDFKDVPHIGEHNFEEFCIASGEGLLETKDKARLDEYLALHPEKQRIFEAYGKIILQPDYLVAYPDKKTLKKREPVVIPLRFLYYATGIAASLVLVFLLVSRKPADQVISASMPAKSTIDTNQKDNPVKEIKSPAVTASEPATSLPARDRTPDEAESPEEEIPSTGAKTGNQVMLAAIEPITTAQISPETKLPGIRKSVNNPEITDETTATAEIAPEPEKTPARLLGSLVKKLNLWKAAETAVTGFNYLTESRVSLVRTTDENGKFSSLSLESEDNFISGNKVK